MQNGEKTGKYQTPHYTTIHIVDRYTDMVNELATVGEDPNQFNEYGEAPLCVAADKGLGMVVAELLQRDNIQVWYN